LSLFGKSSKHRGLVGVEFCADGIAFAHVVRPTTGKPQITHCEFLSSSKGDNPADLLRQRLHQSIASSTGDAESRVNELHIRASQWYEENGLEIEAFQHAAAADPSVSKARTIRWRERWR
jgi:hypothetical protein